MEWDLGAGPYDKAVILIPVSHHSMGFNMGLLDLWNLVFFLENLICLFKSFLNITNIDPNLCGQIFRRIRIREIDIIILVMNNRCARLHGFPGIQDRIQDLVFHIDCLDCHLGNLFRFRRDKCYPVSHKTHLIIKRVAIQRTGNRVGLARSGIRHTGQILVG